MIKMATKYFSKQSKLSLSIYGFIIALFVAFLIGIVDYKTGYELSLSIFYLLPITLIVWFVGRKAGVFISMTLPL